jgi:hypothetical protein
MNRAVIVSLLFVLIVSALTFGKRNRRNDDDYDYPNTLQIFGSFKKKDLPKPMADPLLRGSKIVRTAEIYVTRSYVSHKKMKKTIISVI